MRGLAFLALVALTASSTLFGCRLGGGSSDAGPDATVDAGEDTTPPGDGGAMVDPASEAALRALTRGAGTAAALVGPLLAETEMLRDDSRVDMAGETRRTAVQERVESGVAGNSIVTDPMCVTFDWNLLALRVTITFAGCVMEATGESLDGAMTLDVNVGPTEVILTFDSLMIADIGMNGEVGLRVGGACTDGDPDCTICPDGDTECAAMQMVQQTVWADIDFDLGEAVSISLTDVQLEHDSTGTTVGGTGTISSPSFDGSFVATALTWNTMECLPSSGTVLYQPTGGAEMTITMLSTTPDDGIVQAEIPPFPAIPYPLFDPCPPSP